MAGTLSVSEIKVCGLITSDKLISGLCELNVEQMTVVRADS